MENHPIPQDVTGFQFKLIGNMTIKQFAYLATGIVFAWVLLQLPVNLLIKFPICAFSATLGLGLAFFPIGGRPMDLMIGNYIKALIRPTQFVYEKTGGKIYFPNRMVAAVAPAVKQYKNDFSPFPKDKLKSYLESLHPTSKNIVDIKERNFLTSVSYLATSSPSPRPSVAQNINVPQPTLQINPIIQSIPASPTVRPEIVNPQPQLQANPIANNAPIPPIGRPKIEIPQTTAEIQIAPVAQSTQPAISSEKPTAKIFARPIGTPIAPEFPNLITGITKDARGNALSNILVEVKDKDDNPVRAFKTNGLGRFASATPLINGTYSVEFEDPKAQNRFEKTTINVTGQIIQPIEATSIDTREELRRSLFASNSQAN